METLNTFFDQSVIDSIIRSLKNRLTTSCIELNKNCTNFNFQYTIKGTYIICLLTCNTGANNTIYRMLTFDAVNLKDIYTNGNVVNTFDYTLQTVINNTIASVNHTAKKVTSILS